MSDARSPADYKIVCYYGAWSVYRPAPANFGVGNIDPFSCTHLIYSFAGLDQDSLTIVSLDAAEDIVKGKSVRQSVSQVIFINRPGDIWNRFGVTVRETL